MLASEIHPMPPKSFDGVGIYAVYYVGSFGPYRLIKEKNLNDDFSAPIYVGKTQAWLASNF